MEEPTLTDSELLKQYNERVAKLKQEATDKEIPWTTDKPTGKGLWLGAKWQDAGYYHIMMHSPAGRLGQRTDEFWSGPYEKFEPWMKHITRPKPPTK